VFQRYDFAPAAAVVGLLLGSFVERQFVYSHQISGGDLSFIFGRPIALAMLSLLIFSIVYPILKNYLRQRSLAAATQDMNQHR
jgi:putative tricarboxylic transport membrane protein